MVLLATASKSCKERISSMSGLMYSSGSGSPDPDVVFCGTAIDAGAGGSDLTAGLGRVLGIRAPRCLDGS